MTSDDLIYGSMACAFIGLPVVAALHSILWLKRHWLTVGAKLLLAVILLVIGVWEHFDHHYINLGPFLILLGTLAAAAGVAEQVRLARWQRPLLILAAPLLVALLLWLLTK